jgi:hypothetical protein
VAGAGIGGCNWRDNFVSAQWFAFSRQECGIERRRACFSRKGIFKNFSLSLFDLLQKHGILVPLRQDLGVSHWEASSDLLAQRYFDQGLRWIVAYNFKKVALILEFLLLVYVFQKNRVLSLFCKVKRLIRIVQCVLGEKQLVEDKILM